MPRAVWGAGQASPCPSTHLPATAPSAPWTWLSCMCQALSWAWTLLNSGEVAPDDLSGGEQAPCLTLPQLSEMRGAGSGGYAMPQSCQVGRAGRDLSWPHCLLCCKPRLPPVPAHSVGGLSPAAGHWPFRSGLSGDFPGSGLQRPLHSISSSLPCPPPPCSVSSLAAARALGTGTFTDALFFIVLVF